MSSPLSKQPRKRRRREHHIKVVGVRREPPDIRKLAVALLQYAKEQADK